MRVAIIGRTQLLYKTAQMFAQRGHEVVLVATCKAAPEYTVKAEDFKTLAESLGAVFLQGANLEPHKEAIINCRADIGISMNWPYILNEEITSLFPLGILNAHPGDLPRYRGNACPNWAIINGEDHVSLTIHKMAPGELDSGDIILKGNIPLSPQTTVGEVYDALEAGMPMLYMQAAEGLASGGIAPIKQSTNPADILRVYPRVLADSYLDWRRSSADLERLVRASGRPFSGAYTYYKNKKLVIWQVAVGKFSVPSLATPGQVTDICRQSGAVSVATGDGFLTIYGVSYDDVYYQRASDVIGSLRARLGMVAEDEIAALHAEVEELKNRLLALEEKK